MSFHALCLNLLASGWFHPGQSVVIALTSRTRGEGVTTVALGLSEALMEELDDSVLLIHANQHESRPAGRKVRGEKLFATPCNTFSTLLDEYLVRGNPGKPGRLWLGDGPKEFIRYANNWQTLIESIRRENKIVLIDTGALNDDVYLFWRGLADKALLVIDADTARKNVLQSFRKQIDRSPLSLDGFVVNRRKFPVPRLFYKLVS